MRLYVKKDERRQFIFNWLAGIAAMVTWVVGGFMYRRVKDADPTPWMDRLVALIPGLAIGFGVFGYLVWTIWHDPNLNRQKRIVATRNILFSCLLGSAIIYVMATIGWIRIAK